MTRARSKRLGGIEDSLDDHGVVGAVQGGVAKERVHRGQADVARAHAVVPVRFQVVEERADQGRVQVGNVHDGGCFCGLVGGVDH